MQTRLLARSDIWAIGVTAAFCIMLRVPYDDDLVAQPMKLMFAIVEGERPQIPEEGPEVALSLSTPVIVPLLQS